MEENMKLMAGDVEVPDGSWYASATEPFEVIPSEGVDRKVMYTSTFGERTFALYSPKPFGVIKSSAIGKSLRVAKKVSRGAAIWPLVIEMPGGAREKSGRHRRMYSNTLPGFVWVRLTEVASRVGFAPYDLLVRCYPFTGYPTPRLDIVFAKRPSAITGKRPVYESFEQDQLPALRDRDLTTAWIREDFVRTTICLHLLGYFRSSPT